MSKFNSRKNKFRIFENSGLLNPFKERLKDKLVIKEYIPRSDLMKVLSNMDFLLNFDNNTTRNIPSKLIDYAITGRPVLNIDKNFKFEHIEKFINGDYSYKMSLPDVENFHISKINGKCKPFLKIRHNNAQSTVDA